MSSEVCPFCGKTYKRLKSHLPHCKAAASSRTPTPTKHDVTVNQTLSSSQLAAASTGPTAEKERSTQTLSMTANTSSSPSSSASPPPSTKRKKQKLSEQIKTATMSTIISTQSQSPSLPPIISKTKKTSLRALIEAAKSKQVSKGSLEADRLNSQQTETKSDPIKDNTRPAFLSMDTKPKGAPKMKASKTKKAAQSLSTTEDTSSSAVSKGNERQRVRDNLLVDDRRESEDLSVNKTFLKAGSGHQARITLQDVKATLGRANTSRQSNRPSILSQIGTTDDPSSKFRPGTSLSADTLPTVTLKDVDSCLVTTKTQSEQLPSTTSQHMERKGSKSKQASLRHDGELTSLAAPLLSGHLSSRAKSVVSMNGGLTDGHHRTGFPTTSPSLNQFSSSHLLPLTPQTLTARVETLRADDGLKQNSADNGTKGSPLTQRSLGQVRLRELPEWLACRTPGHPRDVVEMVQRGWQWYYRRYINVKKGGIGGLGMLLAGYCVLSYIWCYPHIKRDRWRKHH